MRPAYSLLLLLAPALAMASPPGALLLPDSVQRPSGTGEASLGAYYANIDADGFRLGPAGALLTLEAGTSNVCAAGASALGAPQGAIDDWAMLTTVWGRCSPIQLEDNMLNVGGFLFGGVAWDFAGNFTGVSMAGLSVEGGLEWLRGDLSMPLIPVLFEDPWFEPELYKAFEVGATGIYEGHHLRLGVARLGPVLTYKWVVNGYSIEATGALWGGDPAGFLRVGYTY